MIRSSCDTVSQINLHGPWQHTWSERGVRLFVLSQLLVLTQVIMMARDRLPDASWCKGGEREVYYNVRQCDKAWNNDWPGISELLHCPWAGHDPYPSRAAGKGLRMPSSQLLSCSYGITSALSFSIRRAHMGRTFSIRAVIQAIT